MDLTRDEEKLLLAIARAAINAAICNEELKMIPPQEAALQQKRGLFVTIRQHDRLRGCLGTFTGRQPLWQEAASMAAAAAQEDPRFTPMGRADRDNFSVEISVLSELEPLDDPVLIEVGRHGLVVEQGARRGVLLPQVATEYDWDRETFLAQTCLKAGLAQQSWRDPRTRIYTFTAQIAGAGH